MSNKLKSRCPSCRIVPVASGKCPRCHQQVRPAYITKRSQSKMGICKGRKFMEYWDTVFNLRPIPAQEEHEFI